MVFTLAKWEDRTRSQQDIVSEINGKLGGIIGVRAFAINPIRWAFAARGAGWPLRSPETAMTS